MNFKFGRRYIVPWFYLEGIPGLVGQPGLQGVSGFAGEQGIQGISGYMYAPYIPMIRLQKFKFGR